MNKISITLFCLFISSSALAGETRYLYDRYDRYVGESPDAKRCLSISTWFNIYAPGFNVHCRSVNSKKSPRIGVLRGRINGKTHKLFTATKLEYCRTVADVLNKNNKRSQFWCKRK